jgi:hypothetical protein
VAIAITAVDHHLLSQVFPREFFNKFYEHTPETPLSQLILFRRNLTRWIVSFILSVGDHNQRIQLLSKLIRISRLLLNYNNFNSFAAFMTAFFDLDVRQLVRTWSSLPHADISFCENMRWLVDRQENFRLYYTQLRQIAKSGQPFILLPEHLIENIAFLEKKLKRTSSTSASSDTLAPAIDLAACEQLGGLIEIFMRSRNTVYAFGGDVRAELVTCFCFLNPLWSTKTIHRVARRLIVAEKGTPLPTEPTVGSG